jgi:chemotaxis protein CheZ
MRDDAASMLARASGDAAALRSQLDAIRARWPTSDPEAVAEVVRAVLATMRGDLSGCEARLLAEVEELGQTIAAAKADIVALDVGDISADHIPSATDELDAIVAHTAAATERILETCETLDGVAETLGREEDDALAQAAARQLQIATTQIYEACSFQDITGQRIGKIVTTLKTIEAKINHMVAAFGDGPGRVASPLQAVSVSEAESLLNGPQLPALAMDQDDIDKLLASFD